MYEVNFLFSKKGSLRFISHLDLMRLFMRALHRSGLPVKITEGFNPHPKLSIKRALRLGVESENEEARIVLREFFDPQEVITRLQRALPEGIKIREAWLKKS